MKALLNIRLLYLFFPCLFVTGEKKAGISPSTNLRVFSTQFIHRFIKQMMLPLLHVVNKLHIKMLVIFQMLFQSLSSNVATFLLEYSVIQYSA